MSQILIVDDQSGMTTVLQEIFQDSNYEVVTASCVDEALEALAESAVDLLITDMVMPGGDGLELIDTVKTMYPELKIIGISGGGDPFGDGEAYLRVAKEKGADRCLVKPFKVRELVALAKEVLGDEADA
jgi:two-component system, NtrC family, response regulator